jgi:LacI family transcriptional regulator
MAMGIYRALQERGLSIPGDMSVIGFDNQDPIPGSLFPGLTTIGLPHYEMGAAAVDNLAAQLAGDPTTEAGEQRLPCEVVERHSVGTPR